MGETAPQERKIDHLNPAALQPAEYQRNIWIAKAAKGVRAEDLVEPTYWAHVSAKLKVWDKIEVRAEDGTWYVELIVLDASRNWARVKMLHAPLFLGTAEISQAQAEQLESTFEVMHRGPRKWSVLRKADRAVMVEELETKVAADAWLKTNLQRLVSGELKPLSEKVS